MKRRLAEMLWKLADPLVLKMRDRLRHFDSLQSANSQLMAKFGSRGIFEPTVRLNVGCNVINHGLRQQIEVGAYSCLAGEIAVQTAEARLRIGRHCFVGNGSRVWSASSVEIGDHVLISHLVDVHDSDSHSLDFGLRRRDAINLFEKKIDVDYSVVDKAPVRIEDDAWLCFKSTILKGVTVGRGAVVAAGAVVTMDVPPFTLVAGNPARPVRKLDEAA